MQTIKSLQSAYDQLEAICNHPSFVDFDGSLALALENIEDAIALQKVRETDFFTSDLILSRDLREGV